MPLLELTANCRLNLTGTRVAGRVNRAIAIRSRVIVADVRIVQPGDLRRVEQVIHLPAQLSVQSIEERNRLDHRKRNRRLTQMSNEAARR